MSKIATVKMYLHRPATQDEQTDLYAHRLMLLDGGELDLADWRGRPTLFVNTASKCGFTPQYGGLQTLYERYHASGLNILGSPSGDFADQEFEQATEIGAFCQKNYGVEFPLTERTSVREHPDAFWQDLTTQPNSAPPTWNFTKYL
ncbi:MAG TPA: glutathione peroxidase, partial [Solirubrobacteraceae bacterium]|nr:glutathione peroxidase [Solirubrobacteraceae bacterium]